MKIIISQVNRGTKMVTGYFGVCYAKLYRLLVIAASLITSVYNNRPDKVLFFTSPHTPIQNTKC